MFPSSPFGSFNAFMEALESRCLGLAFDFALKEKESVG